MTQVILITVLVLCCAIGPWLLPPPGRWIVAVFKRVTPAPRGVNVAVHPARRAR